jgi:hypothetical protein
MAAAVPYRKKSYHSVEVPTTLAAAAKGYLPPAAGVIAVSVAFVFVGVQCHRKLLPPSQSRIGAATRSAG